MQQEQLNGIINDLSGQLSQRSLELAAARAEARILNGKLEKIEQEKAADVQQETEVIVNHTDR